MKDITSIIQLGLGQDQIPETFSRDQVEAIVRQALFAAADTRSDMDETRLANLLAALKKIEDTTTDTVAGMIARQARINDED